MNELWKNLLNSLENKKGILKENKIYSYIDIIKICNSNYEILSNNYNHKIKAAVLCRNEINTALNILTCIRSNIVCIPLSIKYGKAFNDRIIYNSDPDIIFTDNTETAELYNNRDVFLNGKLYKGNKKCKYEKELEDVAFMLYTSGTTGFPKGAMITYSGIINNIKAISEYFCLEENDRILIYRPLYHCAALTGEFLVSLINGLDIIFYSNDFDIIKIKNLIEKENISVLCGTPTIFRYLSIFKNKEIFEKIKKIAISGECMNSDDAKKIYKNFNNAYIFHVYGLSENSPRVSYLPWQTFNSKPESVGLPIKNTEIFILDENMGLCKNNQIGQIAVKSPSIMKGYYKNITETEKKLINGMLLTGDMGYKDSDGYLYIKGRLDNMIIKNGINIYPSEIEKILNKNQHISESFVSGYKNKNGSVKIRYNIVLNNHLNIDILKNKVFEYIKNNIPIPFLPDDIIFTDSIEKTKSGKIIRGKVND